VDNYEITVDNYVEMLEKVKDFSDKAAGEYIRQYVEQNMLLYEE
jgi:hypothetical protein